MALWDVFHSDRLELVRGLSSDQIALGLASGEIRDDDLARPSGTTAAWVRIAEVPELLTGTGTGAATPERVDDFEDRARELQSGHAAAAPASDGDVSFPVIPFDSGESPAAEPSPAPAPGWQWSDDEDEDDEEEEDEEAEEEDAPVQADQIVPSWELTDDDLRLDQNKKGSSSRVALPVVSSRDRYDRQDVDELDEEELEPIISLSRSGPTRVEELDLAAMVDVAFQLVLFFLVTATTILYKTLEIPKPSTEPPPGAVAQGRSKTLDELQEDYILVEIDAEGAIKIDREPVAPQMEALAEQLRTARERTGRTTMLLSADFATPHRSAVLAYDAANEIGLGIAIAKPPPPQGPAPVLKPGQPAAIEAKAQAAAPAT